MRDLPLDADRARGAVEIAGDDVPGDAAGGQMIERGHPPREQKRLLIGEIAGDAKTQMAVTAAMAGMISVGSLTGTWTAPRTAAVRAAA